MPIILGRPYLNTTQALVDVCESKLTLQVGYEAIKFRIDQALKHSKISDDTVFSMDIFDTFLENETNEWKETEADGFMTIKEENFDV